MHKLLLLTAITLHFTTSTHAQDFAWAHRFGSTTSDVAFSTSGDQFGNIYVTGYFNGTADFDPGPGTFNLTSAGVSDIFVLKLSAEGELIWARQIGGAGTDQGNDITVDDRGYVILTGNFEDTVDFDPGSGTANLSSNGLIDVFVLKLDPDGNFNWVRQIGGPQDDAAAALTTDARGNVYTCGSYRATVDFDPGAGTMELSSAGESDIYILKLDWKGEWVWARSIGGTKIDAVDDLTVDADGFVYTLGEFRGTADFDPGPGTANMNTIGFYSSLFVQKMDHDGNYVWAKQVGGSYFQYGNAIKTNPSGELLITGSFSGTTNFDPGSGAMNFTAQGFDIFVLSLSAAGNLNWVNHIVGNSSMSDSGESLDIGTDGSIYVCGYFSQTADFNAGPAVQNLTSVGAEDGFLMKLDPAGALLWARRTGGTNIDNPRSLYLDPFDNLYTVGSFWGTSDLNPLPAVNNLISNGGPDIFIQKLSQNWNFSGLVFDDLNTNGVQDTNEIGVRNVLISVPETGVVTTTDEQGTYHIYSNIVGDTLKAVKTRPYWVVAPEFAIPDSMETPMNFGVSIPYEPDLCLLSVSTTRFRPGFMTDIQLQIVNTGFVPIDSAIVELLVVTADSPGPLQFVSGNPAPEVLPNDYYRWKIVPPLPGETFFLSLTLLTLSTTPINTPITLSTTVGPDDDVYPENNRTRFIGNVVSAVDPNDKQVSPPGLLPAELDTSTLQYVIRFQNTGNYPAEFVVIRDTLPQELDLATLQVFGASHPFNWRLYGDRILEFRFDPIVLPDSISDEPGSHGFVVFQVKPRAGLHAGDSISNRAGIYFDYNEPVITPAAVFRVIDISTGTAQPGASALEFGLSPNPASRNASVRLELPASASTADAFIAIYDQQGRMLRQMRSPAGQHRVYLTDLPAGVWVVQVGMNGLWGSKVVVVK